MRITSILRPEVVITEVSAASAEAAVAQMVSALAQSRGVDAEAALKDIAARDRTASTLFPVGSLHLAVPHATTRACKQLVLAARLAKSLGIRHLVLQNMLNTPKYTWGIQDLAKSRALLPLVRELEDGGFRVILQPRGGLDYFSPDLAKAKAQLATVAALMDDIEPRNAAGPQIVHVVSYSEASHLADPAVVNESIQITRQALEAYRRLRAKGDIDDMTGHPEVAARTAQLLAEARTVLRAIEAAIPDPYTADGLYEAFARGFLPVPYLWECQEEFRRAVCWQTRLVDGSVKVVDEKGAPLPAAERMLRTTAPDAAPCGPGDHHAGT